MERLADALRARGHSVTVFAPSYEGQEEEEGVLRYATFRENFIGGTVLPNPFDSRIEEEFERQSFDVIHVHHPMLIGRTAVRLSRKYNIPLIFTYHTRYEQYLSYFKGICMMEGWAERKKHLFGPLADKILFLVKEDIVPFYLRCFMRHCDMVFAPTEGMREYLHDRCYMDYDRLEVLPTGILEESFRAAEAEREAVREKYHAVDCPLFLSVSRMSHEKNVEFLIKSVAMAKSKLLERGTYRHFKVLLIGEGPDRAEYEALCDEMELSEEIVFTGSVPNRETAPYYSAADAFLFASRTETQGIVLLEAFAGATPVYAVDASGVRDLVKDGVNGRLFHEDEEEFSNGIVSLLEGREPLKPLAEGALRTALQYREEMVAQRAVSGYTYVCQRRAACHAKGWRQERYTGKIKASAAITGGYHA